MDIELKEYLEAAKKKYGSFNAPDYSFVSKANSKNPYESLLEILKKEFEISETTDPNDDVSFCYNITWKNKKRFIELSMLGKFAVIFKKSAGSTIIVNNNSQDKYDMKIINILERNGFKILTRSELETLCPANLINTERDRVCIYQLIFSDTNLLPWKV